ncbi:hypothetical protein [Verrucomicrobium sp. BvORR106]|uniref:hypothetical protein n=1 Tax=Verrucomicrobium sp. BvORR106 TaxID=1403819 RepID=UPI000571A641|nr:hypothetical protein [Verrucomicrobium sp. BvORR106]
MKEIDRKRANVRAKTPANRPQLPAKPFVVHLGVKYPLLLERGLWRVRTRKKGHELDDSLGEGSLDWAKKEFYRKMAAGEFTKVKKKPDPDEGTMQNLMDVYEELPKRASDDVAESNISRLAVIIRTVFGREPNKVAISEFTSKTWEEFQRIQQGGKLDLSKRHPDNQAINSAIKQAKSVMTKKLWPSFAQRGITINPNTAIVQWLPEGYKPPAEAKGDDLVAAWEKLQKTDLPMWYTIGLARFAGLRREEISAMRPEWVIRKKGVPYVRLMDRPEDGFFTKTGKPYQAIILREDLAKAIEALPVETLVVHPKTPNDRDRWFEREPQAWIRPFAPKARLPLHRLRGLYVDQVAEEQEEAIAARQEAVKKASKAVGHTTTKITEDHYLTPEALKQSSSVEQAVY